MHRSLSYTHSPTLHSCHCQPNRLWRKRACDTREQSVTCWLPWILPLLDHHHHHHYHRHHHHHQYRHYHHYHHHRTFFLVSVDLGRESLLLKLWFPNFGKAAIRNVIDFLSTSKVRKKVFQSVISKHTIWDVIDLSQSQKEERNH